MVIIGFLLIVAAAAAATVLTTQNTGRIEFHALGHAWNGRAYWLIVAGLITLAVAVVGALAVNRSLSRRSRRDRIAFLEENDDDLADRLGLTADEPTRASTEQQPRGSQHARLGLFRRHRQQRNVAALGAETGLRREGPMTLFINSSVRPAATLPPIEPGPAVPPVEPDPPDPESPPPAPDPQPPEPPHLP